MQTVWSLVKQSKLVAVMHVYIHTYTEKLHELYISMYVCIRCILIEYIELCICMYVLRIFL